MNSNNHHHPTTESAASVMTLQRQMQEKEKTIADLQDRVASLSGQLALALQQQHSRRGSNGGGYRNTNNNNDNGINDDSNNNNHISNNSMINRSSQKRRFHPLSPHAMNVREVRTTTTTTSIPTASSSSSLAATAVSGGKHTSTTTTTVEAVVQRERLGRNASIATRRVLDSLAENDDDDDDDNNSFTQACAAFGGGNNNREGGGTTAAAGRGFPGQQQQQSQFRRQQQQQKDHHPRQIIQRILEMFQHPAQHLDYLNSEQFAKDLLKLASRMRQLLEREPRVVFLQSPAYVFGDIHGNLEDLHFFSDNVWRLGMSLTAGNFLFLGDYVDRGLNCLECVAYLFAMKLQLPTKVFLLRGNHETRDVNGWEEHYGERSFIFQCRHRFGDDVGYRIWEACNQAFDRMPLAAVIDQDIFCVHGGIPRPIYSNTTRIQDILTVSKVAGINPPYEHEDDKYQQVASDCIWSDPASEEQELTTVDPQSGFGESLRGGGAICFGSRAVTDFLQQQDFSYIMRAHEAHAEGVAVSKGARVFTVFSTSKDHNQGANAMAGCILVDDEKLQVINRSPAYKNNYVHRRDSISLANVSEAEIQKRIALGLVVNDGSGAVTTSEMQDWEDFQDDNDSCQDEEAEDNIIEKVAATLEEEYVFAKTMRRSSVDIASMSGNSHDDADWESVASSTCGGGASSSLESVATASSGTASTSEHLIFEPNKRHRSKKPGFASIHEEDEGPGTFARNNDGVGEDEDIETINGEDDDVELRDAETS